MIYTVSFLALSISFFVFKDESVKAACLRDSTQVTGFSVFHQLLDPGSTLAHGPRPHCPPHPSLGHSLELVDDDHADVLPGLQDLLQPVNVVGVWVPKRDVIRQSCDLDSIWAVPYQFVRDQDRPVQAQGLTYRAQGVRARG